jgi:hypothetical protein
VTQVRRSLLAIALAISIGSATASAAAADGWSAPVAVHEHPTGFMRSELGAVGNGAAIFSADQWDPRNSERGIWTETVTSGGATNVEWLDTGRAYDDVLATDAAGGTTVAWVNADSQTPEIRVADRPAGGHFGDAHVVARAPGPAAIGMNARGDTLLVYWDETPDGVGSALYALWRPAGGSFGPPTNLTLLSSTLVTRPAAAVSVADDGSAAVAWVEQPAAGGPQRTAVALRSSGGVFGAPETLSAPASAGDSPDVAVAPGGATIAAWTESSPDAHVWAVKASIRRAGASFGPAAPLGRQSDDSVGPFVGADTRDEALLAFTDYGSDSIRHERVVRGDLRSGAFDPPLDIGRSYVDGTDFAMAPNGRAVLAENNYGCDATGCDGLLAWTRFAGDAGFGAQQALTCDPVLPFGAAAAPSGEGIEIWRQYRGRQPSQLLVSFEGSVFGPLPAGCPAQHPGSTVPVAAGPGLRLVDRRLRLRPRAGELVFRAACTRACNIQVGGSVGAGRSRHAIRGHAALARRVRLVILHIGRAYAKRLERALSHHRTVRALLDIRLYPPGSYVWTSHVVRTVRVARR